LLLLRHVEFVGHSILLYTTVGTPYGRRTHT
jgi:hypothetical protein